MKKSLGAKAIAYTPPVWIVGTYDPGGRANVMAAAWGGICCSKPPCISVSLREATYSHGCIVERKAFTVSIPSEDHAREADYFGMASGRDVDKFAESGLTAVPSDLVDAPYVDEFLVVIECELLHTLEIGLHTMFVGEIRDVKAEESVMGGDGAPDIARIRPIAIDHAGRAYYALGESVGMGWSIGKDVGRGT